MHETIKFLRKYDLDSIDAVRMQHAHIHMGNLWDQIVSVLTRIPILSSQDFWCCHVWSQRTDMSFGVEQLHLPFVPRDVQLTITFVSGKDEPTSGIHAPTELVHRSRNVVQWHDDTSRITYVTFMLRGRDQWDLRRVSNFQTLRYLFTVISVMAYNWKQHRGLFSWSHASFKDFNYYFRIQIQGLALLGRRSPQSVFDDVPFYAWGLNKWVWRRWPNLIPDRFWTQYTAYFWLRNVWPTMRHMIFMYRTVVGKQVGETLGFVAHRGLLKTLEKSAKDGSLVPDKSNWLTIERQHAAIWGLPEIPKVPDTATELYQTLWP